MKHLLYVVLASLMFAGCGGSDVYERISSAEMAYATEDATTARRICDEIMNDAGQSTEITASQYGRMSILYMQLYDRTDDADALEMATKCYRSAYSVNSDSAAEFYNHLPLKHVQYGLTLSTLVEAADNPADISDGADHITEEGDSVTHNTL